MHLKNLNIINSFNITGRGIALVSDLPYDSNFNNFNSGDTFKFEEKLYEIVSVEAILKKIDDNKMEDYVAFLVKEITPVDLLKKLVTKKESTWLKKAKWRQRNQWWLKIWQSIQLQWLLFKKNDNSCK